MKILFLVNWKIHFLERDDETYQAPDKYISGKPYWFFRHFPTNIKVDVDVIDYSALPFMHKLESKYIKFYTIQAIKALINSRHYDLVISHGAQSAVAFAFLRTLMGKKMPPHLVIDAGCFNGARDDPRELMLIKMAARSLSGIIYHARIQYDYYARHMSSLLNRTVFIPFGVDSDYFFPQASETGDYILSFGYLKRDYSTLINAWRRLDIKSLKLHIVGMNKIGAYGISDLPKNIKCTPRVPISTLKNLIASARFVVIPLPYFRYSYGQMSILQSMSMGKAVIVTRTPGVIDYVIDNENGFFVNPYDINDLSETIAKLLKNPQLSSSVGHNARITVTADFNEKIMAERIYNFIMKTMARKKNLITVNYVG